MKKLARKTLKHLLGWSCLVAGAVMLVTPGQGVATMLAGIFLLADEIPFFARIRDALARRFPRVSAIVHRRISRRRRGGESDENERE